MSVVNESYLNMSLYYNAYVFILQDIVHYICLIIFFWIDISKQCPH